MIGFLRRPSQNERKNPYWAPAFYKVVGMNITGAVISLDGTYDSKKNRKMIFNAGMVPNINEKNAEENDCSIREYSRRDRAASLIFKMGLNLYATGS